MKTFSISWMEGGDKIQYFFANRMLATMKEKRQMIKELRRLLK